jgi:signal transduction histidine kinase
MFVLHGLINWFNHREPLYALFVARQVYLFLYTAALFGLHRYLLYKVVNPLQLDSLYSYFVIGATAISFVFESKFQREYMLNKYGQYALNVLMVWLTVVCMTMVSGQTLLALKLNMSFNAVSLIVLLLVAVFCIDRQKIVRSVDVKLLDKTLVVGYYLIINAVLLSSALSFLGFTKANHYTVNILIYYTLIAGVLMTILMQLRTNKLIKAHNEYEQGLLLSRQQVAMEKERREEQAHLLHMLMHELKNPLAIIEMAQYANNDKETTTSYISRSVKNMNDVIDRCIKADKLSEGNVQTFIEQVDLHEFVTECIAERDPDLHDIGLLCGQALIVNTDQQLLKVMINNLLDNAIRYGDSVAPVELTVYRKADAQGMNGVAVTISNRPSVASWPDADKVFTKYYRSEGAKAQSGTGLGLHLVRTLARLVGGECRYIPDDKFIKFELWLPS